MDKYEKHSIVGKYKLKLYFFLRIDNFLCFLFYSLYVIILLLLLLLDVVGVLTEESGIQEIISKATGKPVS